MYPLIEIQTVPIEIKMTMKNASLEYTRGTAEMEISRDDQGGLNIKSHPIRLQVDTYSARDSVVPDVMRNFERAADEGTQAAYEATAAYAQQGKLFLNAKVGEDVVAQIAKQKVDEEAQVETRLGFLPEAPADISWEDGEMEIRYDMDKLNFDWKISNGEFKFTPGDIQFSVEQLPDVLIKYMGGPIYVPPSADPDYVPLDVEA